MSRQQVSKSRSKQPAGKGATSNDVAPFLRVTAEWKGYVNVELSKREAEQYAAFISDADLVRETTAQMLLSGYRMSIVQVDDEDTVKATATAAFKGMPDSGLAVSAWAGDFYEAAASVVFIVAIHARLDLSRFEQPDVKKSKRTFA